jgi:tRNA(Ile)-lysidine synthase TilS/MesJ
MSLKKSTLLLFFLKELLEGKKISLKSFALENDINIRTAQRYIEDISEIFSENLIREEDTYSFVTNHFLEKNPQSLFFLHNQINILKLKQI